MEEGHEKVICCLLVVLQVVFLFQAGGIPSVYAIIPGEDAMTAEEKIYADATQTLIAATPRSVTTVKDSYQMFKFTPPTSGTYQFSTDLTSGDPQIFLFYANGVLLMSDDDDGDGLNALMDYYMTAGITYYIAVQGYAGNAASFSLTVTKK